VSEFFLLKIASGEVSPDFHRAEASVFASAIRRCAQRLHSHRAFATKEYSSGIIFACSLEARLLELGRFFGLLGQEPSGVGKERRSMLSRLGERSQPDGKTKIICGTDFSEHAQQAPGAGGSKTILMTARD
jgi:hypothetical protein